MEIIKVYCTSNEKQRIVAVAEQENLTASKYMLRKGLSDLHERATVVELISCMVQLLEAGTIREGIQSELLEIAQSVLEGKSISEARTLVSEVCVNAHQGN